MKTDRSFLCLACSLGFLWGSVAQAQSMSASAALWAAPRLTINRYPDVPPGLTNAVVDSGQLPIGRCRANALTDGAIGIEVIMNTDVNRGLDVYSGAGAGLSDKFLLRLQDAKAYSVADSTVIRVRVHGAMQVAPPSGYAELKIMCSYPRGMESDYEYGTLVLYGQGGQASWTARNDTEWYPDKTNLFLHPANQGLYPVNQAAAFNKLYEFNRSFFIVLPKTGPADISGQALGLSVFGTVASSGGRVAFYDTMRLDPLNPVSFRVSATGVEVPLLATDQFASQTGLLTSTNWSYPVVLKPMLAIRNLGQQVAVSWPEGLDQTYQLQRNADPVMAAGWTLVSGSPTGDGTNYTYTLPQASPQEFYRLKAGD